MKVAIVKLSAMGDIIHAMVALEFIKKISSNIQIDWIVEKSFQGVLENNPDITNILPLELKKIKKSKKEIFTQYKLVKKYATNNYDIIIDAQGLLKSAFVAKLLRTQHSVVYGFDKKSIREGIASYFYDKTLTIPYNANTIDRNVRVLTFPFHIMPSHEDILGKKPFLYYKKPYHTYKKPYNVFVIGSTWESRNYPKEKFLIIAETLKFQTIVVWGNNDEYKKALWLQEHSSYITIAKKGNLNDLKALISNAKLLIGNDTGPTHMAWGLNVPSITIFGPTPTNRVYITPINKVIKSTSHVNHYKLNKNDFSIQEIQPEEIIIIAKELLSYR